MYSRLLFCPRDSGVQESLVRMDRPVHPDLKVALAPAATMANLAVLEPLAATDLTEETATKVTKASTVSLAQTGTTAKMAATA